MDDVTRSACCARDEELARKNNQIRKALKAVDITRKALEARTSVFSGTRQVSLTASNPSESLWLAASTEGNVESEGQESNINGSSATDADATEEKARRDHDSFDDSDFDDEDAEIWQKHYETRLREMTLTGEKNANASTRSTETMAETLEVNELDKSLHKIAQCSQQNGRPVFVLLLMTTNVESSLLRVLAEAIDEYSATLMPSPQSNQERIPAETKLLSIRLPQNTREVLEDIISTRCRSADSYKVQLSSVAQSLLIGFYNCLPNSKHLNVIDVKKMSELEQLSHWELKQLVSRSLERLYELGSLASNTGRADDDDEEEQGLENDYDFQCEREGCTRRFSHKHFSARENIE